MHKFAWLDACVENDSNYAMVLGNFTHLNLITIIRIPMFTNTAIDRYQQICLTGLTFVSTDGN